MSWQDAARRAARRYGIPEEYFIAQMGQEAHGQDLTSPAGAQGPAQIMPATAEAWGLSPAQVHNRGTAYDAAAKHMAQYMKQFGSFRDALVAYNAGPGRVGGSLPRETQDYIRLIMGGGKDVGKLGSPDLGVGMPQVRSQDPGVNPFSIIGGLQASMPQNPYSATQQRGWELLGQLWEQKHAGQQMSSPLESIGGGGTIPKGGKIAGGLHEAFYDPVGGYDEGKSIGAIGGHDTHAHFGGDPAAIARIVRIAQKPKWGLDVREYSPVDKVDPVHTKGSWHYKFGGKGGADISGNNLSAFFRRILRKAGWK